MKDLFSLGKLHISDFLSNEETPKTEKVELKLILEEETGAVRLEKCAPLDLMYGKYWYRSGVNNTMRKELSNIVTDILEHFSVNENDIWLDIACNDGTLLSNVPETMIRIGVDPADDSFKVESEKHANLIIQDFFSYESFTKTHFKKCKAKVVTSIAMFYDLDNPGEFIRDIHKILDDDGLWVMQLSYTPLMIEQMAFDNICHEHIYYYSLFNIKKLLESNGFMVVDCRLNDINGGSFRIYIMKSNADVTKFSTQPNRDVCKFRVNSLIEYEKSLQLDSPNTWHKFFNNINTLKDTTVAFIKNERAKGKKVWAYGASTKGNTLLQYFGLDHTLIDGIAERNLHKWGLRTVGTDIPIFSEDDMRKANPDYLLILPWHFISEFRQREIRYLEGGGKFIVPCPKFEVIEI
jgi:hypothetical protein